MLAVILDCFTVHWCYVRTPRTTHTRTHTHTHLHAHNTITKRPCQRQQLLAHTNITDMTLLTHREQKAGYHYVSGEFVWFLPRKFENCRAIVLDMINRPSDQVGSNYDSLFPLPMQA